MKDNLSLSFHMANINHKTKAKVSLKTFGKQRKNNVNKRKNKKKCS